MRKILRPLWFTLAVIFLAEAWLWHRLVALGHWLVRLLPFEPFKRAVARFIAILPPWATLIVFVLPILIIEPFKLVAIYFLTHGHLLLGILGFIAAKIVAFAIIAFLFELCRDKLMQMAWFRRFYALFVRATDWAHNLVDPYKAAIKIWLAPVKARVAAFKGRLRAAFAGGKGPVASHIRALRLRLRRSRPVA